MENIELLISKKNIAFYVIIICLISFGLKVYVVDFSSIPFLDTNGYVLHALSIKNGEFSEPPRKTLGWPLFAAPFFYLINSDSLIDYVNLLRMISIGVSVSTVPIMYLLARKFFSQKYSLVATCLLAFEPHLNQISGQGLSEPLYIFAILISFYFILNKKTHYLAFVFASFVWWIRWPGVIMFVIISIIFFVNNKKSSKLILKYGICVIIFLIIASPMLIHRYEQYGNFFYFSLLTNFFSGEYGALLAQNTDSNNYTVQQYIDDFGFLEFINKFILTGIYNMGDQIFRMLFPYLIVLIPFGVLFSFRSFDKNPHYIRANWLLILITLCGSVVTFSLINERRFLFYLYPFVILFCTIPIERVTKYGLSTFSFSEKQKTFFLLGIIIIVLILSLWFSNRYISDAQAEEQKIEFARFQINNFDGKTLISNDDWKYAVFLKLDNPRFLTNFKINYKETNSINETYDQPFVNLYAKSVSELIDIGEQYDLKYLVIVEHDTEPWYDYLNDVYQHESKYPYLTKIFDSTERGFDKFKVKAFVIDYAEYHSSTG